MAKFVLIFFFILSLASYCDTDAISTTYVTVKCRYCNGTGEVKKRDSQVNRLGSKYKRCYHCQGKGRVVIKKEVPVKTVKKNKPVKTLDKLPPELQEIKKEYRAALRKLRALIAKRRFTGGVVMPKLEEKIKLAEKEVNKIRQKEQAYYNKQKKEVTQKKEGSKDITDLSPEELWNNSGGEVMKNNVTFTTAQLEENKSLQAFKDINFEDSIEVVIYKIKQHKDISFNNVPPSKKYIFCDSQFAGSPCEIYFAFNDTYKLVKINISLPEQSASYYNTSIKDNWQKLHDIAVARFGKPNSFFGFPSLFRNNQGYVQYGSKWGLKYKTVSTGICCSDYKYYPILMITYIKHVIQELEKEEAQKAAAKAKAVKAL